MVFGSMTLKIWTMYKAKVSFRRPGYKTNFIEGIYVPSRSKKISVVEMKEEVVRYLRSRLVEQNSEFEKFEATVTLFKKMRTDFVYNAEPVEKADAPAT